MYALSVILSVLLDLQMRARGGLYFDPGALRSSSAAGCTRLVVELRFFTSSFLAGCILARQGFGFFLHENPLKGGSNAEMIVQQQRFLKREVLSSWLAVRRKGRARDLVVRAAKVKWLW